MTYKAVLSSSDARESLNGAAVIHTSFQAVALLTWAAESRVFLPCSLALAQCLA